MTPQQKIKHIVINKYYEDNRQRAPEITSDNLDEEYEALDEEIYDILYDMRSGEVETNLPCESSRHYESYSVGAQAPDGSWVGWTYWYGGGKHGEPEPEAIDWMQYAYNLNVTEEVKVVQVFSKDVSE